MITGNDIPCICMTCGVRNNFTNLVGFCQNGHDDWLEYRDVFLTEGAEKAPRERAKKIFGMTANELKKAFSDTSILVFKIVSI